MTQNLKEFFLDPEDQDDDYSFLAQIRSDTIITPIVDGIETFKKIAQAIANAKKVVNFAAWIINPNLKLVNSLKVGNIRVYRWIDLFREVAKNGVEIRIIITDFDPVLQNNLHKAAWSAYNSLMNQVDRLPGNIRHKLQVICSRHEATISAFAETILAPRINTLIKRFNNFKSKSKKSRYKDFIFSPGLWCYIQYFPELKKKPFKLRKDIKYIIYPASHHQKVCTVDGKIGFLGGLDIQRSRYDSAKHNGQLWHDIHCRLEGLIVEDLDRNFSSRWDREVDRFIKFVSQANSYSNKYNIRRSPIGLYIRLTDKEKESLKETAVSKINKRVHAQIHRTISEDATFGIVPSNIRKDILDIYEKVIEKATSYIYIENQYVRSSTLVNKIIERYIDEPGLSVIIVLPVAPEEVKDENIDRVTNHGLFLQNRALTELKTELGNNLGIFSLLAPKRYNGRKKAIVTYGSLQIYVHSKLLIVDDIFCSIGTANTNPRSFLVDTEIAVGWYHKQQVKQFRLKLWRELLGNAKGLSEWKPNRFLFNWNKIASDNTKRATFKRVGFVIPHDFTRFKGKEDDDVPDEFAIYYDFSDTATPEEMIT